MKLRTYKKAALALFIVYATSISFGSYVWKQFDSFYGVALITIGVIAIIAFAVLVFGWSTCPECKKWLGRGFKMFCSNCGSKITNDTEIGK
jgi:hypothetical protein